MPAGTETWAGWLRVHDRAAAALDRFAHHRLALVSIAAVVFVARLPVLAEFVRENPFSLVLRSDAALYWRLAAEIAAGRGFGGEPLLIAPLYPLALAALQTFGANPTAVAIVQLAVHAATVLLVGAASTRLWGRRAGVLAALGFAVLAEPALFAVRIQSVTLQLFAVAGLWWATALERGERHSVRGSVGRAVHTGAWAGLLVLAFPAALLLLPLLPLRCMAQQRAAGLPAAGALLATALAVVSPATWHNWRASGELIPVTAHAGITLAHGNGPRSIGIYTPVEGVSTAIERQHVDAAAAFELAHGRAGSWGEVDGFFRDRAIAWWLDEPSAALGLLARKLLWFATSRDYDNVVAFGLEREAGLHDAAWSAPLAIPWLLGLAAVGLVRWLTGRFRAGSAWEAIPELALLALPIAVCGAFYFSARYRVVLAPVMCGLAAFAAASWLRERRIPARELALGVGAPLLLGSLTMLSGFTLTDFARPGFERALETARIERAVRAERASDAGAADQWLLAARSGAPESPRADLQAAVFALGRGQPERALAPAKRALARASDPDVALRVLYNALGASQRDREALPVLRRLAADHPGDPQIRLALGWLLATSRDPDVRDGRRALQLLAAWLETEPVEPQVALVSALAQAEAGDRAAARALAERGAARARSLDQPALARDLESLARHLESGAPIRLPARALALPGSRAPAPGAQPVS